MCDAVGTRKSAYAYSQFWQNPPPENPWREPVDIILDYIIECSTLMEHVDSLIQSGDPSVQDDNQKGEQLLLAVYLSRINLTSASVKCKQGLGFHGLSHNKNFSGVNLIAPFHEISSQTPLIFHLSLVPSPIYCGGQLLYSFILLLTTYSSLSVGHETTSHLHCGIFRLPTTRLPRVP